MSGETDLVRMCLGEEGSFNYFSEVLVKLCFSKFLGNISAVNGLLHQSHSAISKDIFHLQA